MRSILLDLEFVKVPDELYQYLGAPLCKEEDLREVAREAVLARLKVAEGVEITKRRYKAWVDAGCPSASGAVINR